MKKNLLLFAMMVVSACSFPLFAEINYPKTPQVRALYLSDSTLCDMRKVDHYIQLAKKSMINSYVIDVKGVNGLVRYESAIAAVRDAKAWSESYDIHKITAAFHKNHIRVIGRIVCFMDPCQAAKKPEWAIKDLNGQLYNIERNEPWLNPVNKEVWEYLLAIAKECLGKGIDEIQFDYLRFPTDGRIKEINYGIIPPDKPAVINSFLAYAREQMPTAVLSADVFGIICESPDDLQNIGQNLDSIGRNLDYISPMTYPALFAPGQIVNDSVFAKPDLDPYGVVFNTLLKAGRRISEEKGYRAKIRPYLQAFTASWLKRENYQTYGPRQIRQQIKAAKDAGCKEWIFWNEENNYPEAGFLPVK